MGRKGGEGWGVVTPETCMDPTPFLLGNPVPLLLFPECAWEGTFSAMDYATGKSGWAAAARAGDTPGASASAARNVKKNVVPESGPELALD